MAGRGFNVRTRPLGQTGVQIAAERGHTREISSIIFHLSFYVLLVGIGISQVYSFDGQVDMTEGGTFTDTRLSYGQVKSGPGWALDDHRGFRVTLDDFAADFHPTGTPAEYTTRATVTTADGEARTERIRLNEPAHVDGMTLYVLRYGLAPRLRLTDVTTGQDIFRDTVRTRAVEGGGYIGTAMLRTGEDRQEAMQVALLPGDNYDPARPHDNLELVIDLYQGQLGLGGQSTPEELVPTWGQALTDQSAVAMGERATLGDLEVEYLELPLWAGFQVSRQPGHGVLLLGAALLMASLPGALYSYRRRYWIDVIDAVEPSGRDLHVRLAGVALQRQERFTVEFAEIATALRGVDAPTIVPEVPVEREVSRV
jgi:cytochrome c biogenesis protein